MAKLQVKKPWLCGQIVAADQILKSWSWNINQTVCLCKLLCVYLRFNLCPYEICDLTDFNDEILVILCKICKLCIWDFVSRSMWMWKCVKQVTFPWFIWVDFLYSSCVHVKGWINLIFRWSSWFYVKGEKGWAWFSKLVGLDVCLF